MASEKLKECRTAALNDYVRHLGRLVSTRCVIGYVDGEQVEKFSEPGQPGFKVRVIVTDTTSILHQNYEWLDPYWNVSPEDRRLEGMTSCWIDGPCWNTDTGEEGHRTFVVVKERGPVKKAVRLFWRLMRFLKDA